MSQKVRPVLTSGVGSAQNKAGGFKDATDWFMQNMYYTCVVKCCILLLLILLPKEDPATASLLSK